MIFLLMLAVILFVAMPMAAIWSVNTLFALAIPLTLKTWMAALILSAIVSGGLTHKSKKQ